MASLKLNSIKCVRPLGEGLGDPPDEVYFLFDDLGGTTGNVTTNIIRGMGKGAQQVLTDKFSFSGKVRVSLTEDDGPTGRWDDHIKTRDISAREVDNANIDFKGEGAHYVLNYDVIV